VSYKICVVLLLAVCLAACGSSRNSSNLSTTPTTTTTPTQNNNTPTTTLSAQTGNNTSAANNFPTQANGNLGANNVSKVNVHSLLYSGANTKVLAQLLLWFGQSNHMNVGYNSNDPAQVKGQIADMISRGIDGVIVDWYGPNNAIDQATQLVMHEAENHPGFSFAIMIDAGAIGANPCNGCSPQQVLVNLLQYVEQNYFPSSAYLTIGGQPIVTNFNIDNQYSVDWGQASGQLKTPPRFLFQDNGGFSHAMSDGSYSWVMPWASDYGLGYLTSFYDTGMAFPGKETMGATYKGFNDKLASWGSGRFMDQQCGNTWLQTFSQVNSLYNTGMQLPYLQLVTWNDYEEGTEIESGIDPCFSLQASMSGKELTWTPSGDESTVDHYTVYSSQDGQNLTKLTDVGVGIHGVEMCGLALPAGNYQLYVQSVGKPSMSNRMPAPVSYTAACSAN
jgi:Glycosyl hydrolase family 71